MQGMGDELTPLQSVRESCRKLKQEWEELIRNTEIISSDVLSSLKLQEAALELEQKQVHSLKQDTFNLKKSYSRKILEQHKKADEERKLANQTKTSILTQLGEVKQLQHHLARQLANLRASVETIKSRKQESADSLLSSLFFTEDGNNTPNQTLPALTLEAKSFGIGILLSSSSTAHDSNLILDPISDSPAYVGLNATADATPKSSKQGCQKPKVEVLEERDAHNQECEEFGKMSAGRDLLGEHCFRINDTFVKMEHGLEGEVLFECKPLADQRFNLGCTSPEGCKDELDNVLLSVRLEILLQKIHQRRCSKEKIGVEKCSGGKRKWEVPIEIALKEDAPGLLEKLQERGLLTDISIYDTFVEDDYMNIDDHFKSLEEIARKIWGTTSTLFKQPPVLRQHVSALGKDPSYCLSCLVSLIDQAKSMKQRNWPVEWGWCRELRAFIFVFDKHNRIVLERPEYGNATYFFELVQFLPVRWQVLRLIHVLGVIALGKTALLENKPLEVGYELTDEESKVLESFGWTPGTGLGSFLNFCDRVFHEAKEEANMEWRQKIGKCLMDGYDKGRIMAPTLPPILRHFIVTKTEPYIKAQ